MCASRIVAGLRQPILVSLSSSNFPHGPELTGLILDLEPYRSANECWDESSKPIFQSLQISYFSSISIEGVFLHVHAVTVNMGGARWAQYLLMTRYALL